MNNIIFNPNQEIEKYFKNQEKIEQESVKIEYTYNNKRKITYVKNILHVINDDDIKKIKKILCCSVQFNKNTMDIILSGHQTELKTILKNKYNISAEIK